MEFGTFPQAVFSETSNILLQKLYPSESENYNIAFNLFQKYEKKRNLK